MCEKVYKSAPLPFQGQKRRFLNDLRSVITRFNDIDVVIDLFGGSGLLAHTIKRERPELKVIYNDYDNYCERLANIAGTNELLGKIRLMVKEAEPDKRMPDKLRSEILALIKDYSLNGFVDYLTLSTSLLFSGQWAQTYKELSAEVFYNRVKQTDYKADGYLDGLLIEHRDYKELFAEYKDNKRVLFLVDPPYLSTDCKSYKNYWGLSEYLDVLKVLVGTKFIYFTSNKSQVIELCEWIRNNAEIGNPFADIEKRLQENKLNYQGSFTDIMLVKE